MASWCRAASVNAAPKERSGPRSLHASATYPISGFASECRWRSSKQRATSAASMKGNELHTRGVGGDLGGTMRLGAYPPLLQRGSRVSQIYHDATEISERHRHRYEVNTGYKGRLEQHGMRFSGMSPDGLLPEMIEYEDHPWFIGVQFHPELKSRPFEPHPLFSSFIGAAVDQSRLV